MILDFLGYEAIIIQESVPRDVIVQDVQGLHHLFIL